MAQDVVVNGTTYPAVESVALRDADGNVTMFYPDAVRYVEQNLTPEQQAQARQNIEALSKNGITLGRHENGLLYLFVDGVPVGDGVELPTGGIDGYITADKQIIFNNLQDGEYTLAYVSEDGSIVPIGAMEKDTNVYYVVTNNLTNCVSSNSATQAISGQSYSATITANSGYELTSVTVTMGGQSVSVTNGVINIASVTGDIVITAVAEVAGPAYINQIPLSIGTDGKPFNNGQGYKTGYRLSLSGGGESAQEGTEVTGFIPVNKDSVIRIKNIAYNGDTTRGVVGYDANFTKLTAKNGVAIDTMFNSYGYDDGNGVRRSQRLLSYEHFNSDSLKYIRLCSTDINANSIITVDQEIV